jgi:nucleotide-binding universal stress UspA family protein
MTRFHQILVPVDGSPPSEKALSEAIRLGSVSGAKLILLHVLDDLPDASSAALLKPDFSDLHARKREVAEQLLVKLGAKVLAQGLPLECVVITQGAGRVFEYVVEQALAAHADLIVVGSHGRHGPARALLGSDAEQIIRHAPVPVLVVRADVLKS